MSIEQDHAEENSEIGQRYMEFSLGEECYAMPLLRVKEVIAPTNYTPIPNSASHMLGLINLRGQVLSVFDLRKKLNIPIDEKKEEQAIIIVDMDPIFFGVKVDSINTVLALTPEKLSDFPEELGNKAAYMENVYRAESKLVIMVDIVKLLGSDLDFIKKAA